jgi:hypothetical protein
LRLAPFCSALHGRSDAFDLFELEKEAITQVSYRVLRCRIPHTFRIHSAYINSSYSVAAFRIFCGKHSLCIALHLYLSLHGKKRILNKEGEVSHLLVQHTHMSVSLALCTSLSLSHSLTLSLSLSLSLFLSLSLSLSLYLSHTHTHSLSLTLSLSIFQARPSSLLLFVQTQERETMYPHTHTHIYIRSTTTAACVRALSLSHSLSPPARALCLSLHTIQGNNAALTRDTLSLLDDPTVR